MILAEAVLGGGRTERGSDERKAKAFKDLRGWAEQTNRPIGERPLRRFTRLQDRNYHGLLPDSGELRPLDGEVTEVS